MIMVGTLVVRQQLPNNYNFVYIQVVPVQAVFKVIIYMSLSIEPKVSLDKSFFDVVLL